LVRRRLGFGYWSLSGYLKLRVKTAVNFIGEFEQAISQEAKRRSVDGVICGHIHHMADLMIDGIRYLNCGDWVESCTAIAEDFDGRLSQIRWLPGSMETSPAVAAPVPSFALEGIPSRAASGRMATTSPVRARQYTASIE
jgi:hypothetical protein